MATLVLGAIGGAVAGPFGTAAGALAGAVFDNRTLGRRREGPRLAELAVQTSSYGSAIPLVFGTMRVAGTVIWATDLKESRERGGKGRATTYSYSASFAVALSGRRIARVARIWADGKLLRGAAGDLKVHAILRVHPGGEDQAADPLIASAEGPTPAYRGIAYAVFEDLALAEFGNRIPSLTFEVVADEDGAKLDAVAAACGGRAEEAGGVLGYAASGAARDNLAVVERLAGGWWAAAGAGMTLFRDGEAVRTIEDARARAPGLSGSAASRRRAAARPAAVTVAYYDPARDYQAGVQHGGAGVAAAERIELPAAIDAGTARTLAAALAARTGADRGRRTITAGLDALDVAPGAVVAIAGEPGGRWRVTEAALEAMAVRLTLVPVAAAVLPASAAESGRAATAVDAVPGATLLRVIELPAGDDAAASGPRLGVLAAGEGAGWRRAALWWSGDDGASWTELGETAVAATIGTVEAVPPPAPATLLDLGGAVVVRLAHGTMTLVDADDAALARGANLAAAGRELFQFGRATPLGDGRWRLERLLRGRRGSEVAMAAGDGFALVEAAATRVLDQPVAAIGRAVRVMASGVGDSRPVEASIVPDGLAVRPPAPVKLAWDAAGLRWTRRSRAGWSWVDGIDAPLGEEREAYRVTLAAANGDVREVETYEPRLSLTADERRALASVAVRQRGTWAESRSTTIEGEGA